MKTMKILLIIISVIITLAIAIFIWARYRVNNIKDTHNLESLIDERCKAFIGKNNINGLAIGVIKNGKVFTQCYGYAQKEKKILWQPNDVFEIGSISKVFTATLAQAAVNRGSLQWADKLEKFYPNAKKDATNLQQLVTHTSGYPRLANFFIDKMKLEENPYSTLSQKDLEEYIANPTEKKLPNNANYEYSNIGSGILGNVLEKASKNSYEQLLQSEICSKLNLKHTSTLINDATNYVQGYNEVGGANSLWDFPIFAGAGAIKSNLIDMVLFMQSFFDNKSNLFATHKQCMHPLSNFAQGKMATGWHVESTLKFLGMPDIIWHNGGTGGFSTYIGVLPKKQAALFIVVNKSTDKLDALAIKLMTSLDKISFK